MASNYKKSGTTDLDNILVTIGNKALIPEAYRKSGTTTIWGEFGSGYGWGGNQYGETGQGTGGDTGAPYYSAITYTSPMLWSGTNSNWTTLSSQISCGVGIKTDNTLWGWGNNNQGMLGLGNTTQYSSPVQVGALTNWSSASVGVAHIIAIKTDGTLWTCGYNVYGTLGQGDVISRSSPVQVGALTTWSKVSAGEYHSLAIKTDGTLWSWGLNRDGQLGQNDIVHRSSPVQVGALTTWSKVGSGHTHSLAVKTDGTLWSWGFNDYGQLGQGDIVHRSTPVQVGALTNWSTVSKTIGSISMAIKTDGTLWSLGFNTYGTLGQNDIVHRSSPVQVGALTNWSLANIGSAAAAAIKTDGTLWAWGLNNGANSYGGGVLGQFDTVHRSSPIQIGSHTAWNSLAVGAYHMHMIKNGM